MKQRSLSTFLFLKMSDEALLTLVQHAGILPEERKCTSSKKPPCNFKNKVKYLRTLKEEDQQRLWKMKPQLRVALGVPQSRLAGWNKADTIAAFLDYMAKVDECILMDLESQGSALWRKRMYARKLASEKK